ncbi:MAG: O-antigen ligase family protein [Anaerolineales bacterium]|jgi:O-antigen ligase
MRTIAFSISLLFIFSIPWEGVVDLPGLGTGAKLIGLALAISWLASVAIRRGFRKPRPFHLLVCLFVIWNAASIFWSANPGKTVAHLRTWFQLLGLVVIIWDLYTTKTALLAGLQAFIFGEYVAVGSAIVNFLSGDPFYSHYQRFSPSEQSNPDGFGFIVVLGLPVAWYLASSMSTTKIGNLLKFINYTYIPLGFVGLVLSGTRTAFIASIIAMAFGLASITRLRLASRITIFLLLTLAVFLILPHVQDLRSFQRFSTTYDELTQGDLNNRTNNWQQGLVSFTEHPFLGVGSNMYRSVNKLGKLAHNSYLSVLVELGLVGFILFGSILAFAGIQALHQPKWEASFWLTQLAVWAIGASTLTYEHRKATWLFLGLVIVDAALNQTEKKPLAFAQRGRPQGRFTHQPEMNNVPSGD